LDTITGYAVGEHSIIYKTNNGGEHWFPLTEHLDTEYRFNLYSVWFPFDDLTGYVVGERFCIYKTTDGGESWKLLTEAFRPYSLYGVRFPSDEYTGLLVGSGGRIFKTNDGLQTILPVESGVEEDLYSIYSDAECERAWVTGANGTILRTIDGGFTWLKARLNL
jgi:photosystem II stability/assembly factor-like uncharacterized protein